MIFFLGVVQCVVSWILETPINYDEPVVKEPGPFAHLMPKPVALVVPPLLVCAPLLAWLVQNIHATRGPMWNEAAATVILLATAVLVYALRRACGRFYSFDRSIKREHRLVTTGPYALLAHPGYTSLMLIAFSNALFTLFSPFNLISLAAVIGVLSGVPMEERMMTEEFGEEYRKFLASRKRFIPFVL